MGDLTWSPGYGEDWTLIGRHVANVCYNFGKKIQESSRKAGKAKKAAQKATKSHQKPASLPLRDCSRSAA